MPSLRLSDGPNGVRGTKFFNGVRAACFPCGTALGATFNQDLLEEAGRAMGAEHVLLDGIFTDDSSLWGPGDSLIMLRLADVAVFR